MQQPPKSDTQWGGNQPPSNNFTGGQQPTNPWSEANKPINHGEWCQIINLEVIYPTISGMQVNSQTINGVKPETTRY